MKQIRVLQKQKLLGKDRRYNDFLTEEEFYSISPHVRQALISNGSIEVYDDGSGVNETLQKLSARVDLVSDILQDKLGTKLGDYFTEKQHATESKLTVPEASPVIEPDKQEASTEQEATEQEASTVKVIPKKGDIVMFSDDDGVEHKAEVTKVKPRLEIVVAKDVDTDDVWELGFSDITT